MLPQPPWSKFWKYLATAVLASWVWVFGWASSYSDPKPWYVLALISFKVSVPLLAAIAVCYLDIAYEFSEHSSKLAFKKLLDHIHRKYFPYSTGGLDPECRVTLFRPGMVRRRTLGVWARSGGLQMTSKVRWNIKRSESENFHGIAGYAWAVGIFVTIDGLSDYSACSLVEQSKYRKQTFITEKEASKLHWKARAFRCLVIKNYRGDKVGVLMMESKQPGGLNHITSDTLNSEAEYIQLFLA
jgi:hypothetical protein